MGVGHAFRDQYPCMGDLQTVADVYDFALVRSLTFLPQWGTADTEIKVPSLENPELTNVNPLKPGAGQHK